MEGQGEGNLALPLTHRGFRNGPALPEDSCGAKKEADPAWLVPYQPGLHQGLLLTWVSHWSWLMSFWEIPSRPKEASLRIGAV